MPAPTSSSATAASRRSTCSGLVHGAIFTRGPKDLKRTAIFVGGSDVAAGEALLAEAREAHAAAVRPARVGACSTPTARTRPPPPPSARPARHLDLTGATALVLGGTGPVGQRVARLLAAAGGRRPRRLPAAGPGRGGVRRPSQARCPTRTLEAGRRRHRATSCRRRSTAATLVIAAGAAGVVLLPQGAARRATTLKVAIDLNAVPPLGIEGVEVDRQGRRPRRRASATARIGVGGTKMKIHKAAVARLFESNDQVLDAEEVYALAQQVN